MIYPYMMPWMMIPYIPTTNDEPPRLYRLMNSLANYEKEEKIKIRNLAKATHKEIFDFEYPLSDKVNKEKFECNILNHFINRRIGFETFTLFQIQLETKLNEIMPLYNKMFDSLENWDIFNDGEITTHNLEDNRTTNNTTNATNKLNSNATTTGNNITDNRESNMPQSQIDNVKDGKYLSNYKYNTDNNTTTDISEQNGETKGISNTEDKNILSENWKKSPSDKIAIYKEFQDNLKNIYSLIYKDLDCLFYQLV